MASRNSSPNKRWVVFAGLALVGIAIAIGLGRQESSDGGDAGKRTPAGAAAPTRVDFPANTSAGTDARPAPEPPLAEKPADVVMGSWRNAILVRDADTVVAVDDLFRRDPEKYRQVLMTSAQTDADDRVRAFSTRVLGKLKAPACAPVFQRLLGDKSEYVRMNAAWGLGELASTPEGRAAAKPAVRALRRLEKIETVKDTREAASLAVRRLM